MKRILFIIFLFPNLLFAQQVKGSSFVQAIPKVKRLTEKPNYINEDIRLAIIDYLKAKDLNIQNYFVDSVIKQDSDLLLVNIWDSIGLQTLKRIETKRDSLTKVSSKLKFPLPTGNPGNCFTAYFSTTQNKITAIDIWQ